MLNAVIFDFDGTIGDTLPLCIAATRCAAEPFAGRHFEDEEIVATFGPDEEGMIRALIPQHGAEGLDAYLRCYRELHGMCPRPFDGIAGVLRELRAKGIVVALVTGKGRGSCEISLREYGLAGCFDHVETGSPLGQRKIEGIRAVLDRFRLAPEEAAYVGDTPGDILSARRAGVKIFSAAWASTTDADELRELHPDELFRSVEQFGRYVHGLQARRQSPAPEPQNS